MISPSRSATARLVLTRPTEEDLVELHQLHADPQVWEHFPSQRHTDLAQTEDLVRRTQHHWEQDGLGSWVARRSAPDGRAGELVGLGGCSVRQQRWCAQACR